MTTVTGCFFDMSHCPRCGTEFTAYSGEKPTFEFYRNGETKCLKCGCSVICIEGNEHEEPKEEDREDPCEKCWRSGSGCVGCLFWDYRVK
jgi:hypothetical protein